MDDNIYIEEHDYYELLRFNKWNRRLLNLYWIFNLIVLITEITLFIITVKYGTTSFTPEYHLFHFIFVPTVIMLGITGLCEAFVYLFKNKYKWILPYTMTITCIAYCSIMLSVHKLVVVLCITYIVPVIISLIYDNKNVLRYTFICSILSLILIYITGNINSEEEQFWNLINIITNGVILLVVYLLCGTVLNRNKEILDTLVKAEHSAYEFKIAKNHAEAEANARTKFLANMSHEIRTPMNGILGLAELALDDSELTRSQRDYLSKMKRSGEGLLSIVNDILDISKIDAGEYRSEKIPFMLRDIINECKISIKHYANEKGLLLKIIDETELINPIIGEATRLRQALLNFLSNAVKFTERGSVTLTVKRKVMSQESVVLYFEITDTGIGMTDEQLDKIFMPFKQADESTTRKYGGTGLGLSITKSIIEMLGGEISVESTFGVGSKFSFSLLFPLVNHKQSEVNTVQYADTSRPMFNGRVLVCEDNEINRQVAVESLRKLGLNVTTAENGRIGVDLVKKMDPFDIILMDIHMPEMDGFDASAILRNEGVTTPIIAMTADAMPEDREKCLESGMVDYISKPFKLQDLWTCLSRYLVDVGKE